VKYKNFEDVPVWKAGIDLTVLVFKLTEDKAFRFKGDIANQIQRASLSVPNNIAEGFERGTTTELITFLYYAKGSAGEVRSIAHVIERLPYFDHLRSQISDLKSLATSISRQLAGWAASLQESDIAGPRRLTEQSKQSYQQKQRATEFMTKLKREHEEFLQRLQEERAVGRSTPPETP
jgi:four helix bundle protein